MVFGAKTASVVEGIGFAVEPVALRLIVIDLVLDRDVVERRPFEAAAQPQFLGAGGVVGHVIIGCQRAPVDRHRPEIVAGKRAERMLPETTPLTACEPANEVGTNGVPQ